MYSKNKAQPAQTNSQAATNEQGYREALNPNAATYSPMSTHFNNNNNKG